MQNIIDTAAAAGNFTTLAAALTAANLVETLKGPGPFTFFAPSDAAFAKIPKAEFDALLADKEKLTRVLKYHLIPGKVMADQVTKMPEGAKVKTVEGHDVTVHRSGAKVLLDKSTVTKTDIDTSNGVIHVIDTVLWPS